MDEEDKEIQCSVNKTTAGEEMQETNYFIRECREGKIRGEIGRIVMGTLRWAHAGNEGDMEVPEYSNIEMKDQAGVVGSLSG